MNSKCNPDCDKGWRCDLRADTAMDNRNQKMLQMFTTFYQRQTETEPKVQEHDLLISKIPCNTYIEREQSMCGDDTFPYQKIPESNKFYKDVELEHDLQLKCNKLLGQCPSEIRGQPIDDPILPDKWRLHGNVSTNFCPFERNITPSVNTTSSVNTTISNQDKTNFYLLNMQTKNRYDKRFKELNLR